eukprot:TRINITY_DN27764_c0_g1_i2.p1 TRINITY_DN27764_c0_g1~~TRINITY_DN27764_c0_g1_i2.p1  ORF type:complete len:131 (-),score=12.07 TRINITY_DN27764_c0_g1_i2:160-552(-)
MDATDAFEAMGHSWHAKVRAYGDELVVSSLSLPKEGNLIRPSWLTRQDAVPAVKVWLFKVLMFDVHRRLSYHDFWPCESDAVSSRKPHLSPSFFVVVLVGVVVISRYAWSVAAFLSVMKTEGVSSLRSIS